MYLNEIFFKEKCRDEAHERDWQRKRKRLKKKQR